MLFSASGPLAVALAAASAVTASAVTPIQAERDLLGLNLDLGDLSKPTSLSVSLDADLSGKTLVEAHVAVGADVDVNVTDILDASADVDADVNLVVKCNDCFVKGDINATVSLDNLVPALSLELKDIEAELDLDLYVGVATTVAVNLFTPLEPISLPIAGLEIGAMVYVDLVLQLDAAIDVTAGVYVKLTEEALLEIDILKGELLTTSFTGLAVKTLPIEVRIGCARLQADLRVRVQAGISASVDVNDLIPLGIDIPEIGAGVELGVYANLAEYVGFFCDTPACPLSQESWGLNVGVAADIDIEVGDILDIDIAPTVSVALLTLPTATHCVQSGGSSLSTLPGHPGHSATASVSGSGYPTGAPVTTAVSSLPSGYVTSTVQSTAVYTVTYCAASVANCPASYASGTTVTKTVDVYTTVCPATMSLTAPTSSATPVTSSSAHPTTIVTEVTSLVPCSSTETFTPPASVTPYTSSTTAAVTTSASTASYPAGGKPSGSASVSVSVPASAPVVSSSASVSVSVPATAPVASTTATYPGVGKASSSTEAVGSSTCTESKTATMPGGESGNYPTGSVSYPAGGKPSTSAATSPVASETASYPAGGNGGKPSTSAATSPTASYPAGGKPSGSASVPAMSASYPAGGMPSGSASVPAGGVPSGYPVYSGKPSGSVSVPAVTASYPAGGMPSGSASVPAVPVVTASYPAGGNGGYGNGTVPYATGKSSSLMVQPSKSATPSYPASSPSSTPVAAGAGKIVGSGLVAALAAFVALI
ncbi:hypothetical protein E8E14_011798 [Neopestalotiopsis sp. 37M]|nr:hypothetical protein E8E14_011798 [Neopestalotiopsis sp. 37M]